MRSNAVVWLCAVGWFVASGASAQLTQGDLRLWLDTDVVSVAWVKTDPSDAPKDEKNVVVGIGPNQLGAYRIAAPTTPLGVGVGYALRPSWLLGARSGFGYDVVTRKDAPDTSYLAWSFMPGVWFVPNSQRDNKWYLNFSALLEYVREKQGDARDTRFGGCFSMGAGQFLFMSPRASFDLGFFFEGHFIDIDSHPSGSKLDISDLRWLLRAGASLWR